MSKNNSEQEKVGGFFTMGGKPYQGQRPSGFLPASKFTYDIPDKSYKVSSKPKPSHGLGVIYLIDGDNHVDAALTAIPSHVNQRNDQVKVYVSQEGLYNRLKKQTWYELIWVKHGDQAVDNRIKSDLGNILKRKRQFREIKILSHDKGYDKTIENYKNEFKLSDNELRREECY